MKLKLVVITTFVLLLWEIIWENMKQARSRWTWTWRKSHKRVQHSTSCLLLSYSYLQSLGFVTGVVSKERDDIFQWLHVVISFSVSDSFHNFNHSDSPACKKSVNKNLIHFTTIPKNTPRKVSIQYLDTCPPIKKPFDSVK